MTIQPFYGKGPPPILWAGSQAMCDVVIVIPNCLNYVYRIYLNARWGLFHKFGTSICEVILNLRMKRRTKWL
jgi:hypothetical protein